MASRPESNDRPDAPFGPPDCPWEPMSSDSPMPESVFDCGGKLNGEKVYVGRVYDDEDKSYLIGTAIPSKGLCTYVTKDLKVKTSNNYEILTISCGEPLVFKPKDWESNLLFVAGGDNWIMFIWV
ncbi:hypothetical protein HNY73_005487 [Argiope bruennichi]|uniref:Uncharacterized protein n=1 Tax=Argiope bruennichi TaxID=94029 RepID=A0A8T0FLM3_ARGBR|nr:hypothetical protein HNY73_005487 [Argiope bruennichi]